MKTSLSELSKHFVGIQLDWLVTFGSVTLVRVKSVRVTAMSMTKNILNHWYMLDYQEFNTLFNITRVCRSRHVL